MAEQELWTIRRILAWTTDYLGRRGDEHPRLSAEWLVSNVTGLSRVETYMNFDRPLGREELDAMHAAVARRASGEPLQYVTGEMPFRHIVLHCERGVLIPRPETEVLVDAALEGVDAAAAAGVETVRALEVGTGTGCIALSIASERPGTRVVATDLSDAAVELAVRNRDALGLEDPVRVVSGDLASGVDPRLMGTFSVLVSNPPYIPSALVPTLPEEVVGYEPGLALDGGDDGLDVFRRILELAPSALRPGGMLCCELFEDAVATAADLCREQGGWAAVEVREDLTHRPRVLVAVREGNLADALPEGVELAARRTERVVTASQDSPDDEIVRRAAHVLTAGGVVVVPTDSVYGLCCVATPGNPAHRRIFEMKRRDPSQTLPWFVADASGLERYGRDVPAWAHDLARRYWPGVLTLVVRASDEVPAEYAQTNGGTIALRVPDSELVRAIVREAGVPLAQTSANTHGQAAATTGADVEERLIDMVDLVIDAGPAPVALASTIVDCTGADPLVLREGAIPAEAVLLPSRGASE